MATGIPLPSGPEFGAGHSAQYTTLAEALRLAVETMEIEIAELARHGLTVSAASLRLEARFVTVTLLSAALCESMANTILATVKTPTEFDEIERYPTVKKWTQLIPQALACNAPEARLQSELQLLFAVRNSIMHAKATIFSDGENVAHPGNTSLWEHLNPEAARGFAKVPRDLISIVPDTAEGLVRMIGCSLNERQPRPHLWLYPAGP